jgi:hypothetical protein
MQVMAAPDILVYLVARERNAGDSMNLLSGDADEFGCPRAIEDLRCPS